MVGLISISLTYLQPVKDESFKQLKVERSATEKDIALLKIRMNP
jgi:hypothetical protein